MNRPRRSIDGISPAPRVTHFRSASITRHQPSEAAPKFISLQPRPAKPDDTLVLKPIPKSSPTMLDLRGKGSSLRPIAWKHPSVQPAPRPYAAPRRPLTNPLPDKDVVIRVSKRTTFRARLTSFVQYILLAVVAVLAAYSTSIGQWFVLAYAIYCIVLRKNSQLTFTIALMLLISVPVFQILKQTGVADNMAIYVYELLVVGTLQAIIELKWPGHEQHA